MKEEDEEKGQGGEGSGRGSNTSMRKRDKEKGKKNVRDERVTDQRTKEWSRKKRGRRDAPGK